MIEELKIKIDEKLSPKNVLSFKFIPDTTESVDEKYKFDFSYQEPDQETQTTEILCKTTTSDKEGLPGKYIISDAKVTSNNNKGQEKELSEDTKGTEKEDEEEGQDPQKVVQNDEQDSIQNKEIHSDGEDEETSLDSKRMMRRLDDSTTILTVEAKSVRYTPEYEFKKESQIVTQNVDSTSTDKNSFIVKFEKAFYSDIPKIYSTMTSTSFISCTAIDDNKSLKCIPDSNTMIDGNSYKIVYQKACDGDKVETGITVNYSNSNYMRYTGIFIILGLFLY